MRKVPNNRATVVKRCNDHMPHVEQQSHGCTTLASKHANHLTTSKVRAPLLRVHTTLYDAHTNDRETQCDRKRRTRSPLNFKHAQKSDATAGEGKIACNGSDSSCNVGDPSCECQKARSQSVLEWSCANCERGLITIACNCSLLVLFSLCYIVDFLYEDHCSVENNKERHGNADEFSIVNHTRFRDSHIVFYNRVPKCASTTTFLVGYELDF